MRSYTATTGQGNVITGGWYQCLYWAGEKIKEDDSSIVTIHVARPSEKIATVVGEVTIEGFRRIFEGRVVSFKKLGGISRA